MMLQATQAGPARLEVECDAPGRHVGALHVPFSHDGSAYGRIVLPVTVIKGAPGPTLLLTGGVHGDEYEGPVALTGLAQSLDPAGLVGRVIIVPVCNPPAFAAASRTSPLEGGNLARCFPGSPDGSITQQIAEGINRLLLPRADLVVDVHSGGKTLEYLPCTLARIPADRALRQRVVTMMQAFSAPMALASLKSESRGTLVAAALDLGIAAFATELGGGGALSPASIGVARQGIARVMAALGMMDAAPAAVARLMLVEPQSYARATHSGLFEPAFTLGDRLEAGQKAGLLWDLNRPGLEPEPVLSPASGVVVCRRVPAQAAVGDVLFHLAIDASEDDILES
jgi:predicted deacylase